MTGIVYLVTQKGGTRRERICEECFKEVGDPTDEKRPLTMDDVAESMDSDDEGRAVCHCPPVCSYCGDEAADVVSAIKAEEERIRALLDEP